MKILTIFLAIVLAIGVATVWVYTALMSREYGKLKSLFARTKDLFEKLEDKHKLLDYSKARMDNEFRELTKERQRIADLSCKVIKYAVTESDYLKYNTPEKIQKVVKAHLAKMVLADLNLEADKNVEVEFNEAGNKVYKLTYYIRTSNEV